MATNKYLNKYMNKLKLFSDIINIKIDSKATNVDLNKALKRIEKLESDIQNLSSKVSTLETEINQLKSK